MPEKIALADRKVFERFFKENHRLLFLYALKFVSGHDVANDIVQDAFMKLWEQRDAIVIKTSVKAYLYRMVHNLCLNHIEQQKLRAGHHEVIYEELVQKELEFFNGEKSLLQKENFEKLYKAIEQLPSDYKEIVVMSRLQELKAKEISEKLHLPVRTVETRIYRAINRLRNMLQVRKDKKIKKVLSN